VKLVELHNCFGQHETCSGDDVNARDSLRRILKFLGVIELTSKIQSADKSIYIA
jgi:hypothetical protein